jgi:hypothetical protein
MPEQTQTDVNYDAVNVASQGGPHNPYDDALAFKSLLGAVHGEFNRMVNDNMVTESNTCKKINGKAILEKGVMELMGKRQVQPNVPAVLNPTEQLPTPQVVEPPQQPVQQQLLPTQPNPEPVLVQQSPVVDPGQMEFNFDNSATAQQIFDKLEDIDIKLNNLYKLVESLQKKPTARKTVTKKK